MSKTNRKKKKYNFVKFKKLPLFLTIIIVLIFIFFLVILFQNNQKKSFLTVSKIPQISPTAVPLAYNSEISIFPTPTIDTIISTWKTYTNTIVGYTIKAPPEWKAEINNDQTLLNHQDYVSNFGFNANTNNSEFGPDDPNSANIDIPFPFNIKVPHKDIGSTYEKGLKGLENSSNWSFSAEYITNNYTEIEGRRTLIVKSKSTINPPPNLRASYCSQCSTKYVYIDLGNGKILTIEAYWGPNRVDFEPLFDKFIATLHFTY